MAKYGDLLVGLAALIYTILAVILKNTEVADLGAYLAQPALSGPFAMAALGRGWNSLKKAKQAVGGTGGGAAPKPVAGAPSAPEGVV